MRNWDPSHGIPERDKDIVNKNIKGIRVYATHSKFRRQYRINKLADIPADRDMFECDGNQVSVAGYFREHYGIELRCVFHSRLYLCLLVGIILYMKAV